MNEKPWRLIKDKHNGPSIVELNDHGAMPVFVCWFAPGREKSARQVVKDHNYRFSKETLARMTRLYPAARFHV